LKKARERGLPVSDNMTDDEINQLIFAPGFSTADQVTDVSGRGVGMDVVKQNVQCVTGVRGVPLLPQTAAAVETTRSRL
ncbi:hypothetical protein K4H00_26670, partial [Mycobacterium tuberculosis]|nr:hypothetical protein [Mycobacterium tuberculosis]